MTEEYYVVTLKAYAFDTEEQAIAFLEALAYAFMTMPGYEGYAASCSYERVVDQ